MKKVKIFFWMKSAGVLSALLVMLLGTSACKGKRNQTKYGPPPVDYDEPITKYGVPVDYEEVEFEEVDTTSVKTEEDRL